eukprot:CAMPEP_0197486700 /NCGR_PEP_ID=MMETSP1311-20131121/1667_1 /TAXON_ID=464262 /ORGANISM="Genus nov. species nov., Strain RCC856" /LENGTH=200 /DNA_ID=CAMNT_0043029941 /DNA_START=46 /DNA_END=648 /DNA_ORIENTATION=-
MAGGELRKLTFRVDGTSQAFQCAVTDGTTAAALVEKVQGELRKRRHFPFIARFEEDSDTRLELSAEEVVTLRDGFELIVHPIAVEDAAASDLRKRRLPARTTPYKEPRNALSHLQFVRTHVKRFMEDNELDPLTCPTWCYLPRRLRGQLKDQLRAFAKMAQLSEKRAFRMASKTISSQKNWAIEKAKRVQALESPEAEAA